MQWDSLIERLKELPGEYGPKLMGALAVLILGWFVARIATGMFRRLLSRADVETTLSSFLANIVYIGGIALVAISALGVLGVNTASFAAVIAAAGLAIGLALQGSLGNFAAGTMLIFFRPFKTGDYVEAGGVSGVVEAVNVFATQLRTPDNKQVIVGNSQITGGSITNYSAKDTRRVDMVFGIGYDDDIRKAKEILTRILEEDERILKDPAPVVAISALADSSVNFNVRPWVATADYWAVHAAVTERVKLEFDRERISIPYPQQDVHLHKVAG